MDVTAVVPWQRKLSIGETYLLFIEKTSQSAMVKWSYRVNEKRRLESTFPAFIRGEAADTAHGVSLEQARVILRPTPIARQSAIKPQAPGLEPGA